MSTRAVAGSVFDRRLSLFVAQLFAAVVFVGFARTYYLTSLVGGPPVKSWLVHAHGATMTLWVMLFVGQVLLVRTNRRSVHMAMGLYGVGLGAVLVALGFFTAVAAAKFGSASAPPDIPPLAFLAVPLADLVMFVGLFGAAFLLRRRSADHKRLMLLTAVNFLPPALARLPIPGVQAAGPLVFFGVPLVVTVALVAYDRHRTGVLNRTFATGAAALILSYPVRMMVSGTDTWLAFAAWLTTWAA